MFHTEWLLKKYSNYKKSFQQHIFTTYMNWGNFSLSFLQPKIDITQRDSCRFPNKYHGTWNLIEQKSELQSMIGNNRYKLTGQFIFGEKELAFYSLIGTGFGVHFHCVRELQEAIQDRYILRTNHQSNGWWVFYLTRINAVNQVILAAYLCEVRLHDLYVQELLQLYFWNTSIY